MAAIATYAQWATIPAVKPPTKCDNMALDVSLR